MEEERGRGTSSFLTLLSRLLFSFSFNTILPSLQPRTSSRKFLSVNLSFLMTLDVGRIELLVFQQCFMICNYEALINELKYYSFGKDEF